MRYVALASSLLTGLAVATIAAMAAAPGVINQYNAICDAGFPARCLGIDSNGAIAVTGASGGAGGTATLKATAAPPTYVEGSTTNPLSSDLVGNMRVLAAAKASAGLPTYSEGVNSPLSQDLAGNLRVTGSLASNLKATAADPTYIEGAFSPFSADLGGYLRSKVKAVAGSYVAGALAVGAGADGWDVVQGARADARSVATDTTPATVMSVLKELSFLGQNPVTQPVSQSGSWNVGQTGGPWTVTPTGVVTAADGSALTAMEKVFSLSGVYNGVTFDMSRGAANGLNSTGVGLPVAQHVGQCDDTSPTGLTENSFGNARINCTTHAQFTEALPSASAAAGIAPVASTVLETGRVLKAGAGNLYGVEVTTTSVAGYLLVFNATAVPAAGAVTPVAHCFVAAFGTCGLNFSPPLVMSTGISVAFSVSTTPFTKTDSATAAFSGQVQ